MVDAQARNDLFDKALSSGPQRPNVSDLAFLNDYYRNHPTDRLRALQPAALTGIALSHRQLAHVRKPGQTLVQVMTPTQPLDGWSVGSSIVRTVADDRALLVSTVSTALTRAGLRPIDTIHPVLDVTRDQDGELQSAAIADPDTAPAGSLRESWMHFEVNRLRAEDVPWVEQTVSEALETTRQIAVDQAAILARLEEQSRASSGLNEATRDLLGWLGQDTVCKLFGAAHYPLRADGLPADQPDSTLGLASRDASVTALHLNTDEARRLWSSTQVLTTRTTTLAPNSPGRMDLFAIKTLDANGRVNGEDRFVGVLSPTGFVESITRIKLLDQKIDQVLAQLQLQRDSHSGRMLLHIMESVPLNAVFHVDAATLAEHTSRILQLTAHPATRVLTSDDPFGRFTTALILMPRERLSSEVRHEVRQELVEAFGTPHVESTTAMFGTSLAVLHFLLYGSTTLDEQATAALESRIRAHVRGWEGSYDEALRAQFGNEKGAELAVQHGKRFSAAYREAYSPAVAATDTGVVAALSAQHPIRIRLDQPDGNDDAVRRLKLYLTRRASLTELLPVFGNLGVEVLDERSFKVPTNAEEFAHIRDLRLRASSAEVWSADPQGVRDRLDGVLTAWWQGQAETDALDGLVLAAGLSWQQVVVLRNLTAYLRQAGSTHSMTFKRKTLVDNPAIARALVDLFETRFDPSAGADSAARSTAQQVIVGQLEEAFAQVATLDEEVTLRQYAQVIRAMVRTNFYQPDTPGELPAAISCKISSRELDFLPEPKPLFEIWVYSPRVEGIHLRFGKVARGGLRWSDRREDFRTEILGLVKAQTVKNAVIVPTGSKGGFYAKQAPSPTVDREAWAAEGKGAYQDFIASLLDVTDNLVGGAVVAPNRVVRHDEDDPYLVVAADKGTASFSDIANAISVRYSFWLGDAFASGGSAGFDHKEMGITARGAWESVKHHFRDLCLDTQTQDFTVIGVGDMSGDVFGNGMLLSQHIKLVAAFDHRDVFVDPNPDPQRSFAERQRLFELPRSSWQSYDQSLLSEGGGVWPRGSKSIPLSPELKHSLGIAPEVATMSGTELIRAILQAPVDLLWNGGIGTYVKASHESQQDARDQANNGVRVDATQLRCRVVGEGGNLGFTQAGRVEAALAGVALNTDAIDNAAGVNTSDHEVNIKITLNELVRSGELTLSERDQLLAGMVDEVGLQVLRDSYAQNVLLGNARAQDPGHVSLHLRMMHFLEEQGYINRELEGLPTDDELINRVASTGRGITSPEQSVLVAWSKLALKDALRDSSLADDPWFEQVLVNYFPAVLRERFAKAIAGHPLRKEIIVNAVANKMVNHAGITFVFRAVEETGASVEEIARAFIITAEASSMDSYLTAVEALDNVVTSRAQSDLYLAQRAMFDDAVRWLLGNRAEHLDLARQIEHYGTAVAQLPTVTSSTSDQNNAVQDRMEAFVAAGVPSELARTAATMPLTTALLDQVEVSDSTGMELSVVAAAHQELQGVLGFAQLLADIEMLPQEEHWDAMARTAIRSDAHAVLTSLVTDALRTPDGDHAGSVDRWLADRAARLARAAELAPHQDATAPTLASVSVRLRTLRSLS